MCRRSPVSSGIAWKELDVTRFYLCILEVSALMQALKGKPFSQLLKVSETSKTEQVLAS